MATGLFTLHARRLQVRWQGASESIAGFPSLASVPKLIFRTRDSQFLVLMGRAAAARHTGISAGVHFARESLLGGQPQR